MKVELSKREIEQILVDWCGQRMGQPFNQVTFYHAGAGEERSIYTATVEFSKFTAKQEAA